MSLRTCTHPSTFERREGSLHPPSSAPQCSTWNSSCNQKSLTKYSSCSYCSIIHTLTSWCGMVWNRGMSDSATNQYQSHILSEKESGSCVVLSHFALSFVLHIPQKKLSYSGPNSGRNWSQFFTKLFSELITCQNIAYFFLNILYYFPRAFGKNSKQIYLPETSSRT